MNDPLPTAPISPLRQRLIDDMNMRRFSRETQRNYIRDVGRFATFVGRSPDTSTAEDLRRFQVAQREAGVPVPTMNSIVSALRFFFTHTLDRPDLARRLVRVTHPRKLPVVLSPDEVARLLNATTCLKHQAALSVAYGAGLRVAEVSAIPRSRTSADQVRGIKSGDPASACCSRRVERVKGGQYRNAMLSADMLALLRQWWKVGRQQGVMHPKGWLFPGQHPGKPISTRQLHRIAVEAARAADIAKRVGPHTLRHSFATHLLEDGVDIRVIQALLGHAKLENTAFYTKVATRTVRTVTSPLDKLGIVTPDQASRPAAEALRASLEVADIFRAAGPTYRAIHAEHLSLAQLKVMSAIEHCRTAALGGHVEACEDCEGFSGSLIIAAATDTAPSVGAAPRAIGSPSARPTCCRSDTSMSSSPCRPRSPTSPRRTRRLSTICSSARRPRRF